MPRIGDASMLHPIQARCNLLRDVCVSLIYIARYQQYRHVKISQ